MRVTYFDEVKANPQNGQDWYYVGGLSVPDDEITALEEKANALAEEVFGTRDLTPQTEFHAAHIYFGKGAFKGVKPAVRVNALVQLARTIGEAEGTKRVYAAVNTTKLYGAAQAPEIAFALGVGYPGTSPDQLSAKKGRNARFVSPRKSEDFH